jgi:hypothetical protein
LIAVTRLTPWSFTQIKSLHLDLAGDLKDGGDGMNRFWWNLMALSAVAIYVLTSSGRALAYKIGL